MSNLPIKWILDPKTLRLFVSVVEQGTIAAAAKHENIAASALSKRISDLEYLIGVPLISRSNTGIVPTDAGRTLLDLARRALNDFGTIYSQMCEYASGSKGHLRIVANISAITQFLPSELKSFLADHPGVQVQLEDEVSSSVAQAIADNSADVGLLVLGPEVDAGEIFEYEEDELVLVVPLDHPLAPRDSIRFHETVDLEYVGLHSASTNGLLIKAAGELGRPLKMPVKVKSYDALSLMVEAGLGLGVLPRQVAEASTRAVKIKIITMDESWTKRKLGICVRSYADLPIVAKQFVDHLRRK